MPPQTSEFEREMQRLDAEMKRLEAEYNMFFAGRLPRLPWETRARVDALVKRYDRMHLTNTAQRFRFDTLQARYAKFCQVWERALKAKEEGRPARGRPAAPPPPPSPPPVESPSPPTAPAASSPSTRAAAPAARSKSRKRSDNVVHVAAFRQPSREESQLQELFERLSEARHATGEHPISFDRLADVVQRQVDRLGGMNAEVVFRVLVEDGKVTLTAKRRDLK